jgi:hypothetical protein
METQKRTEWKTAPKSHRSLAYRERKINEEEDFNEQLAFEERGLNRDFPHRYKPGNFWYDHCATTEQQAILDQEFTTVYIGSSGNGLGMEETYVTYRFEDNPDRFLSGC